MKLNIRAFTIAAALPPGLGMGVISIWSRISLYFGIHFMQTFNSIHPHPFTANLPGLTWWEHGLGIGLDVAYVVIDTVILTGSIVFLYNRLIPRSLDEQKEADEIKKDLS